MVRLSAVVAMCLMVGGCVSPERVLPEHPMVTEGPRLIVPHRDWIAQHCYPHREQLPDGRWVDRKRCEIK